MKRKRKKERSFKISSQDFRNMEKAADRKIELERGRYSPTTIHRTSIKDEQDRQDNTIPTEEVEEYLEEYEDYEI